MKPKSIKSLLALALLAPGALFAQTTAKTSPVGYISLGDTTSGQPAVKANTDVFCSIPFGSSPVFAGSISAASGSDIDIAGSPALPAYTAAPHLARITTGAKSGLTCLITANTATQLTISLPSGADLTGVTAGDKITVEPARTIRQLFGTPNVTYPSSNPVPAGTQLLAFTGAIAGTNIGADLVFEYDGTDWVETISTDESNATVLFEGETFIIRAGSSSISSLIVDGEVNKANSYTILTSGPAGQDNYVSFVSPVSEVIGDSGLSAIALVGDQLYSFDNNAAGTNKGAATVLEYDGSLWVDTITTDDVTTTFQLIGGQGYVVRRVGAAPVTTVWSNAPTFVPSL